MEIQTDLKSFESVADPCTSNGSIIWETVISPERHTPLRQTGGIKKPFTPVISLDQQRNHLMHEEQQAAWPNCPLCQSPSYPYRDHSAIQPKHKGERFKEKVVVIPDKPPALGHSSKIKGQRVQIYHHDGTNKYFLGYWERALVKLVRKLAKELHPGLHMESQDEFVITDEMQRLIHPTREFLKEALQHPTPMFTWDKFRQKR